MKTILLLAITITSLNLFAAENNCRVLLATGDNYSIPDDGELPQDYSLKLEEQLKEKGYDVVKRLRTGNYTWNEFIDGEAVKLNANAFVFRPGLGDEIITPGIIISGITIGRKTAFYCRMGIEIRDSSAGVPEISTSFNKNGRYNITKKNVCNEVFSKIVDSIPNCTK